MATTITRLGKIWADTLKPGICRHPQCRRRVVFAVLVKSGRWTIFDERPVAIVVEREIETGRESWQVDLGATHFATCIGAKEFRRPR